jgi:hypothetical protein
MKNEKQKTIQQNKALHLGCQQIADILIENNIPLSVALKNLYVRPTMEVIKGVFRDIAKAKYGVESTTQLTRKQINEVWEDMTATLSENTGIYFPFPSEETRDEALQVLDNMR